MRKDLPADKSRDGSIGGRRIMGFLHSWRSPEWRRQNLCVESSTLLCSSDALPSYDYLPSYEVSRDLSFGGLFVTCEQQWQNRQKSSQKTSGRSYRNWKSITRLTTFLQSQPIFPGYYYRSPSSYYGNILLTDCRPPCFTVVSDNPTQSSLKTLRYSDSVPILILRDSHIKIVFKLYRRENRRRIYRWKRFRFTLGRLRRRWNPGQDARESHTEPSPSDIYTLPPTFWYRVCHKYGHFYRNHRKRST